MVTQFNCIIKPDIVCHLAIRVAVVKTALRLKPIGFLQFQPPAGAGMHAQWRAARHWREQSAGPGGFPTTSLTIKESETHTFYCSIEQYSFIVLPEVILNFL